MNNFIYITPEALVAKHPDSRDSLAKLRQLAAQKDKPCSVCESELAWKYGQTGMCFSCTTGESDASDDYELVAP